jgi:acryloyl-coenzyme A reductase
VPLDVNRLYLDQITVMGARGEIAADVTRSLEAAAQGRFKVLIDRVLPLSQAVRAHEIVAARSGIGKVLLDPTRPN